MARIEAALARLEKLSARPAGSDPELADRHKQLRAAVTKSLGQLDALLAGQKP